MNQKNIPEDRFSNISRSYLVCLLLVIIILAVYWQVKNFEFINFDDSLYVSENRTVRLGLTPKGIKWSFSLDIDKDLNYWHPLTWMSHMLDVELYGMNPGPHHLTNLLVHIINTLLLFLLLRRMTGALWRSACVAVLFALHPLNVESVAWVAERKNVLHTFLGFLTIWTYVLYVERQTLSSYLLILLFYIAGLMAKPMLVTLPFVLLLLDYWPLRRFRLWHNGPIHFKISPNQTASAIRLVSEKAPLLVFSLIVILISSVSLQKQNMAV
jgi:hypothetical protein